ncbi:hypothetical protein EIP86_006255 [Pleurotus ostreatoroseus]|nr:hypothetical protein EIP86_006255 [Pleurotus ostreatoroseus]
MSKTISKNTLSLRFMQNAQRAKQQAEVELEQKKIKDDAEWEVSQEVKDAWGLGSSSATQSSSVTHESSYLPFIFESEEEPSKGTKLRGRRSFNAKGQEVSAESPADESVPVALAPVNDDFRERDEGKARRPATISGFKVPRPSKKDLSSQGKAKTAQELVREDIRRRPDPVVAPSQVQAGFLKPAGVEVPRAPLKRNRDAERSDARVTEVKKRKKQQGQKSAGVKMIE